MVVEERWSAVFKLERVRPAVVADGLAELQVRWPTVPFFFAETRKLAEEWTYRWLASALAVMSDEGLAADRVAGLPSAQPLPDAPATTATVRAWAIEQGLPVSDRGRLRPEIWAAFAASHLVPAGSDSAP